MKTLYFEGAGCVPCNDVENCRIRTAFHNKEGRGIYLELSGIERNKYTAKSLSHFDFIGFVDYCHYITEDLDDCNNSRVIDVPIGVSVERKHFEYSKKEILNFVNTVLFCDFNDIKICDTFDGYRVHSDKSPIKTGFDKYNFMEEFPYSFELAEARRNVFKKYDEVYRDRCNSKYSVLSVWDVSNEKFSFRSHAANEVLRKAELPRNVTLYLTTGVDGRKFEYLPKGTYLKRI